MITAGGWMMVASLLGLAVLMSGLGVLAAKGDLPRNGMAGIRIPSTMASDEAWRAGHRAAVPWMYGSGAAYVLSAVAVVVVGLTGGGDSAQALTGVVLMTVSLVPLLIGTAAASRAARAVQAPGPRG